MSKFPIHHFSTQESQLPFFSLSRGILMGRISNPLLIAVLILLASLLIPQMSRAENRGTGLVEELQLRTIPAGGFPSPFCNIIGIGSEKSSRRLLLAPEAGLILAGTYLRIDYGDTISQTSMAYGAGGALRTQLGFNIFNEWYLFTRPELSVIVLFGVNNRWVVGQLASDFGILFTTSEFSFYLDLFRLGVMPAGVITVAFGSFCPGFGIRYYFGEE